MNALYGIIQLIRNTYAHSQGLSDRSIALDLSNSHNSIVTSHFLMQAKKTKPPAGSKRNETNNKNRASIPRIPKSLRFFSLSRYVMLFFGTMPLSILHIAQWKYVRFLYLFWRTWGFFSSYRVRIIEDKRNTPSNRNVVAMLCIG